jgi:hypothetical protein
MLVNPIRIVPVLSSVVRAPCSMVAAGGRKIGHLADLARRRWLILLRWWLILLRWWLTSWQQASRTQD